MGNSIVHFWENLVLITGCDTRATARKANVFNLILLKKSVLEFINPNF